MAGPMPTSVEPVQKQRHRGCSHLETGLIDGRQVDMPQGRETGVVVADQRDTFGDLQFHFMNYDRVMARRGPAQPSAT
jgi:hypothetical protein